MILSAVAATVALTTPAPTDMLPTPNLYHEPGYCHAVVEREVARQMTAFNGQRPPMQYAVVRKLDGCSVPTPVGYHPSRDLGVATPPAKREDAPSNRR
jgi:hypothetical protein